MIVPKIEVLRDWNISGFDKLIESKKYFVDAPDKREETIAFIKANKPTYENIYRVATAIQWNATKRKPINEIMALIEKMR